MDNNELSRGARLAAKPEFFIIFLLVAVVTLSGLLLIAASGIAGMAIVGGIVLLGAIAYFTKIGESILPPLVGALAICLWALSIYVVSDMLSEISMPIMAGNLVGLLFFTGVGARLPGPAMALGLIGFIGLEVVWLIGFI